MGTRKERHLELSSFNKIHPVFLPSRSHGENNPRATGTQERLADGIRMADLANEIPRLGIVPKVPKQKIQNIFPFDRRVDEFDHLLIGEHRPPVFWGTKLTSSE